MITDREIKEANKRGIDDVKQNAGILSGTGSNGEPLILCFDAENHDCY